MDIISAITGQLGLDKDKAEGLAGAALGLVKDQLGGDTKNELDAKIPELSGWQAKAEAVSGDTGGLMGAASGLLGGLGGEAGDLASLAGLASKFNLDSAAAAKLAPLVLEFIKSRVDSELLNKIVSAVPMLKGSGGVGGLAGAIGGLLG